MFTEIIWFLSWPLLILVSWLTVSRLISKYDPSANKPK
jgi:hypothetical protein